MDVTNISISTENQISNQCIIVHYPCEFLT